MKATSVELCDDSFRPETECPNLLWHSSSCDGVVHCFIFGVGSLDAHHKTLPSNLQQIESRNGPPYILPWLSTHRTRGRIKMLPMRKRMSHHYYGALLLQSASVRNFFAMTNFSLKKGMFDIFRKVWIQAFNVFFVFFVTLSLFPGVTSLIRSFGKLNEAWFQIILIVGADVSCTNITSQFSWWEISPAELYLAGSGLFLLDSCG